MIALEGSMLLSAEYDLEIFLPQCCPFFMVRKFKFVHIESYVALSYISLKA